MTQYRIYFTAAVVCEQIVEAEDINEAAAQRPDKYNARAAIAVGHYEIDGAPEEVHCVDVLHVCRSCGKRETSGHETDEFWPAVDLCRECSLTAGAEAGREARP